MKKAELSMKELIEIVIAALAILFVFLPLSMTIYSAYFVTNNPILDNRLANIKNTFEDIDKFSNSALNINLYFPGKSGADDSSMPDFISTLFSDNYYTVVFRSSSRGTEVCYRISGKGSCESLNRGITFFYNGKKCDDDNRCSFNFGNNKKMHFLSVYYDEDVFNLGGVN